MKTETAEEMLDRMTAGGNRAYAGLLVLSESKPWKLSPPKISFLYDKSMTVTGCAPAGGPVWLCVSGGWKIARGKCCDKASKSRKTYVKAEISLSVSAVVGLADGKWVPNYTQGIVENLQECPAASSTGWKVGLGVKLGPAEGKCEYSASFGGSGSWSCSGALSYNEFKGVNAYAEGGVSGTYIQLQD